MGVWYPSHSFSVRATRRDVGHEGGGGGGGGWGGGEERAAIWGGGAVDAGYVDAFLAATLTRVMRAAVPVPAVAAASVLHSAAVGGSVVGDMGPL